MLFFAATATHIKKGLIADERRKPAVRKARHDWARRQKAMGEQPQRLIFLDETGTNTKMTREYGRCLRGKRLKGNAPFRRWGNQTLIAGSVLRRARGPLGDLRGHGSGRLRHVH